jgi:type III secretory pathway component EscR
MELKRIIYFLLVLLIYTCSQAQNENQHLSEKQVSMLVQKMMQFYQQYDKGAPESLKKAKFNEYVNQVNPALSEEEREQAYVIVNAYIMADKGEAVDLGITDEEKQELQGMFEQAAEQQQTGNEAAMQKVAELKQMTYNEYRDYVTQNGQLYIDENEIRKAYNAMHSDDKQRQVALEEQEGKPVKVDNTVQAIDIVNNPGKYTYEEFRQAVKFLKPQATDEEINQIWSQRKK